MSALDIDRVPLRGAQGVEASAGTGKTFAIAHLFLRLLVEPEGRAWLEPRDILVVTYTKAATAELRARIRRRMREARAALRGAPAGDSVLESFVARRRAAGQAQADAEHLDACLRSLDQAAIHTIHAFCQRALAESAFRSGADFDAEFVEDPRPILREIARDFWVARLFGAPPVLVEFLEEHRKLSVDALVRLAERLIAHPEARLRAAEIRVPAPGVPPAWQECVAELSRLWPRAREEVRELLSDPQRMNQNRYRAERVERVLAELDVELQSPRPLISRRAKVELFGDEAVSQGTKRGAAKPEHALLRAFSRLLEVERELEDVLEANARALVLDFARSVRPTLGAKLRAARLRGFDDLLLGLRDALRAPQGDVFAAALAERYPAALIDESQDTDPVQHEIVRRIWREAGAPLFWIGDPKQAIYSFRGADVRAYLAARVDVDARHSLEISRRSDPSLVRAINGLFGRLGAGPELGEIDYRALEARPDASDALDAPAFELLFAEDGGGVAASVAAEITRVLSAPPRLGDRALCAGDLAVLCRSNEQARSLRDELHRRGVPAVLQGDASVFQTEACGEVERIARALAHPGDARRMRAALATRLLGVEALALESMTDGASALDEWQERVRRAHETWRELGFAVALRDLLDRSGGTGRLLAELGGARRLADALQLGELMHLAERKLHLGPLGLLRWLAAARAGALARTESEWIEDAQIRLESEGDAVQLTTVHRSKGLEYGVVYVPFAWKEEKLREDEASFARFHEQDGALAFDLGCAKEERDQHVALAEQELRAEAMRLLYVALTRARSACRVVYAEGRGAAQTALGRLLGAEPDESLEALRARHEQLVVRPIAAPEPIAVLPAAIPPTVGEARVLSRPPGPSRRTSSYTGLVRRSRSEGAVRDHDAEVALGEGEALAGGVSVGLALHEVLEELDFPAASAEIVERAVERAGALHGLDDSACAALARVVHDTLDAPIPPERSFRLRDVTRAERSSELGFVLPVGDGRGDGSRLEPARLAHAFAEHASRAELRDYARSARRLGFAPLFGHLRGYVDLVICREGRWYLLDYKSNRLDDYGPERMLGAMLEHHYVLQYHLYTLALHRMLSRRMAGYVYERDFAGVSYLFVRGLAAPGRPRTGIWFDRPPLALIEALDRALGSPRSAA